MLKRLLIGLSLLAVFAANGGYLLCLQTVAWGKMLSDYSSFMPTGVAVQKILAGEEICSLCVWVDGQQQESEEQAMQANNKHPLLACEMRQPAMLKPPAARWEWSTVPAPQAWVVELATPPPRVLG